MRLLELLRHGVEVRDDVALDPGFVHLAGDDQIQFLAAILRDQGKADQPSADSVEFGIEKVSHGGSLDVAI